MSNAVYEYDENVLDSPEPLKITFEFLETAVHEILFLWRVYPLVSFKNVFKYGICVHQNKHPGVCKYIEKVLLSANHHFKRPITQKKSEKHLQQFSVSIKDQDAVTEKIVFDITLTEELLKLDPCLVHADHHFRCLLLHLQDKRKINEGEPDVLKENISFEISMQISSRAGSEFLKHNEQDENSLKWVKLEPYRKNKEPERLFPIISGNNASTFVQIRINLICNPLELK